jgi:hypothetical protein
MACLTTPQEALDDSKCFACLTPYQLQQVIASLLCKILQQYDPMATCDLQSLLNDAKCFACLSPYQLQLTIVSLLCELNQSVGTGISGVTGVFSGVGAPVADPGIPSATYYDTSTGAFYYWNNVTSTWVLLIGG